ncbi:ATP-binding cassette domain-containing protein [Facklamia lactis]|uniref:ATP-binding cassette domain-containing protein n=1 Tax=Facklamia lactis TaxID=2749967 RepID=UPI0018CDC500|nr:ATP-binding cassette domain-containing protein [Facklamia lactis]MBG9979572.1 ATP-binding cassette domain-containing protein [Facklamia lactis]
MILLNKVVKAYIDTEEQANKPIWKRMFLPKSKKNVIKELSFAVNQGEIVGYIGENGAGKSTTIKMILGIIPSDSGDISVFGKNPFTNRKENAQRIGVLFGQKSHLWWDLPLIDSFKFLQKIYSKNTKEDDEWIEWLMKELEVVDYANEPVRELSLGQRMRGEFICAMLHSPELVILDEPTIGLDVKTKQKIMEIILKVNQSKGTTFLITSHDFLEIEKVSHKIILLNDGKNAYQGSVCNYKEEYIYLRKVVLHDTVDADISIEGLKLFTQNVSSLEYYFDVREISEEDVLHQIKKARQDLQIEVSFLTFSEIMIIKGKEIKNESYNDLRLLSIQGE